MIHMIFRSSYYGRRRSVNSNGFGFGLGLGMVIGYRNGFLARPLGHHTYVDVHSKENYNKRKDGYLECAVANTTVYVTNNINVQGNWIINNIEINFIQYSTTWIQISPQN